MSKRLIATLFNLPDQRIVNKANFLIDGFKNCSGVSKNTPHLDSYFTCEKLISKNWKRKWADWFYAEGEKRDWSERDYLAVANYIKRKYKKEIKYERTIW